MDGKAMVALMRTTSRAMSARPGVDRTEIVGATLESVIGLVRSAPARRVRLIALAGLSADDPAATTASDGHLRFLASLNDPRLPD